MQYFKGVLAVLYVTISPSVRPPLFFFNCAAVGSPSLQYIQFMIIKVHEALWDLSESSAFCKCETMLFVSIVTLQTYILFRKLLSFVKTEKNWSLNVLYCSWKAVFLVRN